MKGPTRGTWLRDLAAVILCSAIAFFAIRSVLNGQDAIRAARDAGKAAQSATDSEQQLRSAAITRINGLNGKVDDLTSESAAEKATIAKLDTAIAALVAQLRSAGVTPIVTVTVPAPTTAPTSTPTGPTPTPTRTPTPTAKPSPTRAPTSTPAPTAAPSSPDGVCRLLPVLC